MTRLWPMRWHLKLKLLRRFPPNTCGAEGESQQLQKELMSRIPCLVIEIDDRAPPVRVANDASREIGEHRDTPDAVAPLESTASLLSSSRQLSFAPINAARKCLAVADARTTGTLEWYAGVALDTSNNRTFGPGFAMTSLPPLRSIACTLCGSCRNASH